ncbi:pentatricopeptide repeat-containing protein [Canna indica]|uniref:Pentatricopeptide repeat-containing protein n=1 Tax=Canna indica TaxID=4628 RepID=A0AAQ3Q079_9LILI|nr:pentatricopeptide repeat-containing protein [Canna indica]
MRNHLPFASNPFSSSGFLTSLRLPFHAPLPSPPLEVVAHASARRTPIHTQPFTSAAFATGCKTNAANRPASPRRSSGRPQDARRVLDKMPHPDNSLAAFCDMRSSGFRPDHLAYRKAVSASAASQNLDLAEQVYALVMKDGFCSDGYICSGFVDLFSKHGRFDDALEVFWEGATTNVVCWNTIIAGAVRNGEHLVALDLFYEMVHGFCMPNLFTLPSVLSACAAAGKLDAGEGVHAWAIKHDAGADVVATTAVIDMYVKCGDMNAAMKQFSRMRVPNVVSWTTIISGFVQKGEARDAMMIFKKMLGSDVEINKCTMTSVLLACSKSLSTKETDQIHCLIMKKGLHMDSVVKDALLSTYAKHGNIQSCERIFEETDTARNATTWSAMVSGLAQNQSLIRSMQLFCRMLREGVRPDKKCCSVLLSVVDCVDFGRQIHSYAIKDGTVHDVLLGSAIFTMYSKCSSLEDSYQFFIRMQEKDKVSWTSMISGFAGHGHTNRAFQLCRNMILENIVPDQMTISAILMACNGEQLLMKGKELHGHALRIGLVLDLPLGSALVSMYLQCKDLASAKRVFGGVSQRDQILWSSLVSGCATNGYSEEALAELPCLVNAGFQIDQFVCSSVLGVCADLWRPSLGEQLHAHAIRAGMISYLSVSSALLTLYAKCGRIDDSRRVFDETEDADLVMYTSMIWETGKMFQRLEAQLKEVNSRKSPVGV